MKKIFAIGLCFVFTLSLIGCGSSDETKPAVSETDMTIVNDDVNTTELLNEGETNTELVNIVDLTVVNQLGTDEELEEFYKDNDFTYYFPSIKSKYIECQFTDGGKMNIVEALNSGKVTISDLDTHNIFYWKVDKEGNYIKSFEE